MAYAEGVEDALKNCAEKFGWTWDQNLYITAYSFRISCASYLHKLGASETRIKKHMGWALTGKRWFDYLRDVEVCPAAVRLYEHVLPQPVAKEASQDCEDG